MYRFLLPVLCYLASAPLARAADAPPAVQREWQVDGVARKAMVYAPATAMKADTPVLFAFHGHGGTMAHAARMMAFQTAWPEAIVVYMQGLNTPGQLTDPEGKLPGWQRAAGDQGDRDLKFFDAVLTSIKADYKVDAKRIYSTGHSNGGQFTFVLWANRGDVLAAVATSGSPPGESLKDMKPKPAMHLAGEADPLVKYAWQQRGMENVRKLNGCEPEGKEWARSGTLTGTEYLSKTGTPFVSLLHPGGHEFPAAAPALIVKFLKDYPKG